MCDFLKLFFFNAIVKPFSKMSAIYLQESDSDLSQSAEEALLTGCNNQHAVSQAVTPTSQHHPLLKDLL